LVENNKSRTNKEDEEAAVNAVWEVNAFMTVCTYQINAVGFSGFRSKEVLLDNQADISIIRPELLWQVQPTSEVVRVNGVGGVQLELRETGYLDNFFHVYTSTEM
jgi:sugar (pentulose or hexulose) kinase